MNQTTKKILLGIILSSVLIFILSILKLGALPTRYLMILCLFLAIIVSIIVLIVWKSNGKTFRITITVLTSVALIMSSVYIFRTENFLSKLANGRYDVHLISAVVLKDSPYMAMDDQDIQSIGINITFNRQFTTATVEEINKSFNKELFISDHKTNEDLLNSLYDGSEKVILFSESQRAFLEEMNPEFSNETRVIYQYSINTLIEYGVNDRDIDVLKDTYTVFVTGIDTDGPVNTVSRSDVNMLLTVNPRTHQILLTSLPRDTHVKLATSGEMDKLTNAGVIGVDESILTLENLMDIEIDYFIKVYFSSVERIVNALGGIEVNSKYSFTSGPYRYNKGLNYLNGKQTLQFVRERKRLPNGDEDRILNQQAAITGILNKVMSPAIVSNYTQFLKSIEGSFVVNLKDSDLRSIIKDQIDNMNNWDIINNAITGVGNYSYETYYAKGISTYVMDADEESLTTARDLINSMYGEKKLEH